ncbi:Transcriptional regulatory protein moc3 [Fusarium oxysporum f. sp. cubense race 1]|uniref:Transcriptional regulatory protein moc3 n=1 Tax=Fusarium oxysporum f. sp. cubense (strain race 1) TaxID=1229664 RepID=N4UD85_FUSC1|nr:Transcriptional regulatory protein moc3 [Fusarium oxysporum f. sp. cubense race 1]
MVNRGASQGCVTCRHRRVKCDERKPWCKACLRLGIECTGYEKRGLRFKDETVRYGANSAAVTRISKRAKQPSLERTIIRLPSDHPQDLAVPFFLTYVTDVGRSLESTRGFLEFVRPALASERHDSALNTAVTATSIKIWSMIGKIPSSSPLPYQLLVKALKRLHQATEEPMERGRDETVLAALVLQMHDTLSAVSGQTRAHGAHREGALTLLLQRENCFKNSKYYAHLVGNLLHSRVSVSVRNRIRLPTKDLEWIETEVAPILPSNPSSALDMIGVSIADLQHTFRDMSPPTVLSSPDTKLRQQICNLDTQLRTWLKRIPASWYPRRMKSGIDFDPSVPSYRGACDIYPSIQVANIWNAWRIYCLILEDIKDQLTKSSALSAVQHFDDGNSISDHAMFWTSNERRVQELVDSICLSIPFYLGNGNYSTDILSTGSSDIIYPSCHDLPVDDEGYMRFKASDQYVSKLDHSRHVTLHGQVHAISVLSYVIDITMNSVRNRSSFLREEQKEWIASQFIRSIYSMRPIFGGVSERRAHQGTVGLDHGLQAADTVSIAKAFAIKVQKELWTISIL